MNKVKRILAVVLAMAMVMAMSLVSFAANETGTITVNGLAATGTNTVKYIKILEPDVTTNSGYKIVDGVTIDSYATAEAFLDADVADQKKALANYDVTVTGEVATGTTWSKDVEAGYYAVYVTNSTSDSTPEVIYNNPMIVSVAYDHARPVEGGYEYNAKTAENSSVTAKFTTLPTTKSVEEKNKVTEINSTVGYTINSYIPSEVTTFTLTDTLTGASYVEDSVVVKVGTVPVEASVQFDDTANTMKIDLTNFLDNNAGKAVTITYDVTVKDIKVGNTVIPNDGKHDYGEGASEKVYTGAITLTKTGEGDDANGLGGAKFNVFVKGATEALKFTWDAENKWYVLDPENGSVDVVTSDDAETKGPVGTVTVIGLDLGTYEFKEVEAPDGYSINTTNAEATIGENNTTASVTLEPATTSMTDTKLSALPSTGGIGITIFTIVGCLIMIGAASMFFMSRRKSED